MVFKHTEIDKTVTFYFSIFKKYRLFKLFKGLEDDLNEQYSIIKNNKLVVKYDFFQQFNQIISTGIEQDSYSVLWSISKIDKYIQSNEVSIKDFNIDDLVIDYHNIQSEKLSTYSNIDKDNYKPIYVTYYSPIKRYIVIDGTHRTVALQSMRNSNVKGILLNPILNKTFMNKESFDLYIFHHNLQSLLGYCSSILVRNFKSDNSLDENSYYSENITLKSLILKKKLLNIINISMFAMGNLKEFR